jgi:hypothetical protein
VSYLTHLIICSADRADGDILTAVNFQLSGDRFGRPDDNTGRVGTLQSLGEHFGGFKAAYGTIWGGVLNYADEPAILDHVAQQPWAESHSIQILLRSEDERWYRMYLLRDSQLTQYAPQPDD